MQKNIPKLATSCNLRVISSKSFKVRAISDWRDLYGNKIQGLTSLIFMLRSPSTTLKLYINTINLDRVFWMNYQYFLPKNQSWKLQKLESRLVRPWILFPYKSLKSEIALTWKLLLLNWLSNCRKLLILGCSFTLI